jgi:hypothetical protein
MNPVNTEPYKLPSDATWLGNVALKYGLEVYLQKPQSLDVHQGSAVRLPL